MNRSRSGSASRILIARATLLTVVLAVVCQLGCGRRPVVVVTEPDESNAIKAVEVDAPIRWTMRPVKYEEDSQPHAERSNVGRDKIDAKMDKDRRGGASFNGDAPAKKAESRVTGAPPPPPPPPPPPLPVASPAPAKKMDTARPRFSRDAGPKAPAEKAEDAPSSRVTPTPSPAAKGGLGFAGMAPIPQGASRPVFGPAKTADKSPEKKPQVWQRDQQRPTFARVYVGDGNSLELVSLHVTVTVEGPRARTVVDHVFRNPHAKRLEGTFEYPLPTGASPSYFAMFLGDSRQTMPPLFARRGDQPIPANALARMAPAQLAAAIDTKEWGTLREARVVPSQRALEVYEDVVRSQIDPALLEYAGGNTFSGRVFPIAPKGFNRVILAYEELLPVSQGQVMHRFPLPDCKLAELKFTLNAAAADCKEPAFKPDAAMSEADGLLSFTHTWKDKGPGGETLFTFTPPRPSIQVISGRHGKESSVYVYARIRPELKVKEDKPFAKHAVFLLDTSLSEHPDRFAVNMKLLRKILENDPVIKQFNILAFNVGATWVEPAGWLSNDPAGREKAFARLDGVVLEGATDLSAALKALAQPSFTVAPGTPLNVFLLSDGQFTWGEPEVATLVARFESRCPFPTRFHCYRTGLGAENQELFDALVRKGGGVFNCFTEADLQAAAQAHRSQCLQVERIRFAGGPTASDVLVAGRKAAIYPGGDLVVAAKMSAPGKTQVVLEGTFLGQKYQEEYAIDVSAANELAPRGWGEIAVASLNALNDPNLESLVTAYSQQFGIGNAVASFLVLENDADYKRFNLEEERTKTVPGGDLGRHIESAWQHVGKVVPARQVLERFLARIEPRVKLMSGAQGDHVKKLLHLMGDADLEVSTEVLTGAIPHKGDVPADYLKARDADRRKAETYLDEAKRRAAARDPSGAVRVLSSIVEEYPGRADALRLVGYRLLDLGMPAHAANLFQQVQKSRPFEPHSYRDLARSLEDNGKVGLAAMQYEIVLAGTWHSRFRDELKLVAQEEYARMMQEAIRRKSVSQKLADHFGERLEKMSNPSPKSDLRVTISWNTDATDIDLWVIEPDGTRCYYQHNKTKNGGELSQDQTQGYGPERYHIAKAPAGEYVVVVHYYSANQTLLAGETHVNVVVALHAGTPQEVVQRRTVMLKQDKEQIEVCRVKLSGDSK